MTPINDKRKTFHKSNTDGNVTARGPESVNRVNTTEMFKQDHFPRAGRSECIATQTPNTVKLKLSPKTHFNALISGCKRGIVVYNMPPPPKKAQCQAVFSMVLLTVHERDEQPADRWPPNTHTRAEKPRPVPASHQMAHLLRRSARRDATLAVPTDRRPDSPGGPLAGGRFWFWRIQFGSESLAQRLTGRGLPFLSQHEGCADVTEEVN